MNVQSQSINSLINFLNKIDGRDKLIRLIQYVANFAQACIKYLLAQQNQQFDTTKQKIIIQKLEIIAGNFSNLRRILRFGKMISQYISFKTLMKNYFINDKSQKLKDYNNLFFVAKFISQISSFLFLITDHIVYSMKIKILENPYILSKNKALCRFSSFMWLNGIICELIATTIEIKRLYKQNVKNGNENENQIDDKKLKLKVLQCFLDFPTAIGLCYDNTVSPIKMYFSGTISSYIQCYLLWQ